ncbi:uncharacterized protein I303_100756 [Kwoniella dejecticola CBS 10117]|uniref:F-box domain-containing protein n=1 Tax=Kwoniella dejecticola CBS 10117 TaxID=1296121 RepID=A0A1A6AFU5_9TREE|nr:uncharacterized protein I303_00758 [Kwoniella dejecticola CBS 10117]OBR88940.1 hypothetical protein I303_00758 [Kwoniella dejecticola CBS 10117]
MSTSSLLHTALQNLHVSQQVHQQSHTPKPPSSPGSGSGSNYHEHELDSSRGGSPVPFSDAEGETDDEELVQVGKGTRPSTPTAGARGLGLQLGQRLPRALGGKNTRDPLQTLPTHIAVRIFIQLDVRALARCDRVCKRWHKSSTLNYVWFLQNRALVLPKLLLPDSPGGKTRKLDNEIEFFDPYDKTPRLSSLPQPSLPNSSTPVWTKIESKKDWRNTFKITFKRTDPTAELEIDPRRVDISSLHTSGYTTPNTGHAYKGLGSGNAARWAQDDSDGGALSSSERKAQAREGYKALGGRKSKTKRKMGGELGGKDKGGANDDGRFEAPW